MDPPTTITHPTTKVDVALSVEDPSIRALNPIFTNHASRPSALEYSKDFELTPVTDSGGPESLTCDIQPILETKPKTLKSREYIQFLTLCWFLYLEGWNDGTNGPLLPRIQRVYGVDYTVVSLIFVFGCIVRCASFRCEKKVQNQGMPQGFITGALSNVILSEKLGFGKVRSLDLSYCRHFKRWLFSGSLFQVAAYSIASSAPPFPVFVFSYFLSGIGMAVQNAQSVGYVSSLKENTERKMGLLMSGAGALSSPLVATQFSQLKHWSFHYLISLGLALLNTGTLLFVFRLKR
ncbi:hypothetical protein JVU11DRAFT_1284 [Chiua virens]|nr:hypothetical protein JVU11DRAFT_1284 [Chiua virens]